MRRRRKAQVGGRRWWSSSALASMKSFLIPLTEPLGLIWALMAVGVVWLSWRRQWRSALWLGIPANLISLIGSTPLAEALVGREEARWVGASASRILPPLCPPPKWRMPSWSLGADTIHQTYDVFGMALSVGASRLLTGIEVIRQNKAKWLVFGGAVSFPDRPGFAASQLPERWFLTTSMGHAGEAVATLGACGNTHDEALRFSELQK